MNAKFVAHRRRTRTLGIAITFKSPRNGTALIGTKDRTGLDNRTRPDLRALTSRTGDESSDNLQWKLGITIFVGEAVGFLTGIRQLRVAEASQNGRTDRR